MKRKMRGWITIHVTKIFFSSQVDKNVVVFVNTLLSHETNYSHYKSEAM